MGMTKLGGMRARPSRAARAAARRRFVFDRRWDFDVAPARLWEAVSSTPSYQGWWPWLRAFNPVPLVGGVSTSCSIGPPLPYVLAVDLTIVDVVPQTVVAV